MSVRSFLKKITGNVLDHYPDLRDASTWNERVAAMKHQSGEETPDNAEACVIFCPRGGLALLLVHTPFEPWHYTSVDFCEVLKPAEGEDLKKLVSVDSWIPLEKSS